MPIVKQWFISFILDLIVGILECAISLPNQGEVRDDVAQSIITIGIEQPSFFLSAMHNFMMHTTKMNEDNRTFVLKCINRVLEYDSVLNEIDEQQLLLTINLVTQEMTLVKESEEKCALAASDVLVTIAKASKYVEHVMDALLQKFPPGLNVPPHRFVLVTLAMISECNYIGFIPYLVDILSRAIPLFPYIRSDSNRLVWARSFCAFCEALREYATSLTASTQQQTNIITRESNSRTIEGEVSETFSLEGSRGEVSQTEDEFLKVYADQFELAYESIFGWLSSREQKVRSEAANCIGELCLMIPRRRINDDLRKIVLTLLAVHRKSTVDQHLATQGICHFLEATCRDDFCPLEPYLEEILNTLFPFVCVSNEPSVLSTTSMRNQNEALRCFHVAAARFADKIVYYLLHKMQNVQDSCKLGAINVLRHLVNSSGPYMEDKYSLVILGLKPILQTTNENNLRIRVRKAICQLCVALADHGYVKIGGGEQVILFLINNLTVQDDSVLGKKSPTNNSEKEDDTPKQLRLQCGQALQTIAKTCDSAYKLLWPLLFEYVCAESYIFVLVDVFKCLRILVERQELEKKPVDFITGFDNPNVAGSLQVLSRLFTCLGCAPMNPELFTKAYEALKLMRVIASWFHHSVALVISEQYPRLEVCINELSPLHSPGCSKRRDRGNIELRSTRLSQWHKRVFDFITACVVSVMINNEVIIFKVFLMECLGCVLAKITDKTFVIDHLVLLFRSVNHSVASERVGCARSVGFCAATHTDLVLTQLENITKWENMKKSSGIFGFIKDAMPYKHYTSSEMISLRATVMLSYGYVLWNCPVDIVTEKLEQTVFIFLRNYLENSKETIVREALLETLYRIGITVHPSHLNVEYRLTIRDEMLSFVKEFVRTEPPEVLSNSIRQLGSKAVAALVRLDPPINDTEVWDIGAILTTCTFPLCRERGGLKTIDDDGNSTMMDATLFQYYSAIEEIVKKNATVSIVTELLKLFQPYYSATADHERARAVDASALVLKAYFENATDFVLGVANDFGPMSSLLARLVPRMTDTLCSIRHSSLKVIHWTFRLAYIYRGFARETLDNNLFDVNIFSQKYLGEEGRLDGQTSRKAVQAMASVIDTRLPHSQMQTYFSGLFDMLNDRQSQVSSAAAQLLTYALTQRGESLCAEAETIVITILSKLPEVHSCLQTYTDLLAAFIAFASRQLYTCIDVLLLQPLPFSEHTIDAWRTLAHEHILFPQVADYVIELMITSCGTASEIPYDVFDAGGGSSLKIIKPHICALTSAVTELIKAGEPESEVIKRIPNLLATLMVLLASIVDTQYPITTRDPKDGKGTKSLSIITPELKRISTSPANLVSGSVRAVFIRTHDELIIERMNSRRAWSDCSDPLLFINAITVLVRSLGQYRSEWIQPLLQQFKSRNFVTSDAFRVTSAAVFSSLVEKYAVEGCDGDTTTLDSLVENLMKGLEDKNLRIRKLSVRGFGDLAACSPAILEYYSAKAIQAAMQGLDDSGDRRDEVAMEALNALSKLASRVDNEHLLSIMSSVLLKLRPCFEKERSELRAVSFGLFGELGNRVGDCKIFKEQLLVNIVSILLHLNDEDESVRQKCSTCFLLIAPLLDSDALDALIVQWINETDGCLDYLSFLKEFCVTLAFSYSDRINYFALSCNNYFKSSSSKIRANAAHMTGFLLGELTPELRSTISKELIFSGLLLLLKDHDVKVRLSTARAISHLHGFS
uniref:Non-specific serine/threonine protein kinase n=1 Tax=Syphacia muris TaxID=451379 RepID=A0A0N5A8P0_9BILA